MCRSDVCVTGVRHIEHTTDASRLVCVVVVSYQEYLLTHLTLAGEAALGRYQHLCIARLAGGGAEKRNLILASSPGLGARGRK